MAKVQLTSKECQLLLEAFTNWLDTEAEQWTREGEAVNPEYQTIIEKLESM